METPGDDDIAFNIEESLVEMSPPFKEFLGDLSVDADNLEKMYIQLTFLRKQYESEDAQELLGLSDGGAVLQDIVFASSYFEFVSQTMMTAFAAAKNYDAKVVNFLKNNPEYEEHLHGVKKESMCNYLVMARNAHTVHHIVDIWRKCVGYLKGVPEIQEEVNRCVSEMEYTYDLHNEMLRGSKTMYRDILKLISEGSTTLIPPGIYYVQLKQLRSHQAFESYMLALRQWKQIWRMLGDRICIPFYQLRDLQYDLVQSEVTRHYWERMIERHDTAPTPNSEVYAVRDVVDKPVAVSFAELRGKAPKRDAE